MVVPLCRTQSAFFNNQRYPSHSLAHPPLSQAKRQRLTTQLWLLTILLNIEKGRFFQNRVLYKTTKGSLLNAFFFFQSIYFFSFYHIHSVFMCNDESNLDKKKTMMVIIYIKAIVFKRNRSFTFKFMQGTSNWKESKLFYGVCAQTLLKHRNPGHLNVICDCLIG